VLPLTEQFEPHNIIETVRASCDDKTVVATDVGQHQMWTMQHYRFEKPRTLLTSGGLGTMGYGLGAAIGGSIANDRKKTILFTSDGSFGMNLNELATAVTQELPVVVVILNNGVLGMVRQWQNMFFGQRYSQTTLDRKTDFSALANAFGAQGHQVNSLDELRNVLENLNPDGPTVIDCHIDKDELVLPMIPPGGSAKDIVTSAERG
jgi:acetolactate synthase-1/2/3 large subunit